MRMEECSREDLWYFKEMLTNPKIRLENVSSTLLHEVTRQLPLETLSDFKERIVSFDGTWDGRLDLLKEDGFHNLVKLVFALPNSRSRPVNLNWTVDDGTIRLPSLETIIGSWDAGKSAKNRRSLNFLTRLFRPDEPRSKVTEMELNVQVMQRKDNEGCLGEQPLISSAYDLETSFPNLTRLSVTLEHLSEAALCSTIEGISKLSLLEELSLTTTLGVPEFAFFQGDSDDSPCFLRLKKLRKLRLASFYSPPGGIMSDELMRLLSKMSLTHLHIVCRYGDGLEDVTSEGIRALVNGPFGRSILWAGLDALKEKWYNRSLSRLEKICHGNRFAAGLTSISFKQFKASKKPFYGIRRSFLAGGWIEYVFPDEHMSGLNCR